MTAVKKIAASIKSLIHGDTFARVLDYEEPIDDVIETLKEHWEYNIEDRSPGPAYLENGVLKPTDLDLACLLATLAKRKAIVWLPKYLAAGPTQQKQGQVVMSADNRRGQIVRLSSNKETFSFSMLVVDQNVMNTDKGGSLGAPRYFLILGKDGRWHPGWDTINFVPDATENDFIKKYNLAAGTAMAFKQFVHPSRWTSFYGQYYFLTRAVIQRLEAEGKSLRGRIKEASPASEANKATPWEKDTSEETFNKTRITVPQMDVEVDAPFVNEDSAGYNCTEAPRRTLDELKAALKAIDYEHLPPLRFAARATELAFYKARGEAAGFPSWIQGAKWEEHLIKRTSWRRLVYSQLAVGQKGVALRYRIRAKEIDVAAK